MSRRTQGIVGQRGPHHCGGHASVGGSRDTLSALRTFDGFADQFGGHSKKKLKTTGFKELLIGLGEHKMTAQKKILDEYFEKWKRNEEQTDDILVAGFKVD